MRALAGVLVVSLVAGCQQDQAHRAPEALDQKAKVACGTFENLMAEYDSASEDEIRSLMIQIWDNAQFSQTTGIRLSARELMVAVFGNLDSRVPSTVRDMRTACAGRASPYPTLESNDRRG
jgi:hypothetical protein